MLVVSYPSAATPRTLMPSVRGASGGTAVASYTPQSIRFVRAGEVKCVQSHPCRFLYAGCRRGNPPVQGPDVGDLRALSKRQAAPRRRQARPGDSVARAGKALRAAQGLDP